ncbi:MAG: hypothetical protein HN904_26670 [Victivallales bacterium]|jgi:hypothetical protein|nr:hypothetical protein [Victivallales bacterium]MBT7166394.1 hypothetical protein [Victivallales bacterium]
MPIESVKLPEFLKSVKKPKYVLGTTYTLSLAFFESVVFPHIDRSRLKSCVLICDHRQPFEWTLAGEGIDYG